MTYLSIVIPCYNEQESLPELINKIAYIQEYKDIEFVLVDNGSTDQSHEIISKACTEYSNMRLVTVIKNQGYGYGIKKGVKHCQGCFVGWTHADSQVDPTEVLTAYQWLKKNCFTQDVFVKGIREKKNRTIAERLLTNIMGKWSSHMLGVKMVDINGQPNIYPVGFKDVILRAPNDVMIETYCYYKALKLGLIEKRFKVQFGKRKYGKSRLLCGLSARIRTIKRTMTFVKALRVESEKNEASDAV